ncbi:hypothetical protein V8C44DRAFT_73603 [Trichoderma aethiopicum]
MAVLGKRKAPEPSISTEDAQEIFRRHFEAQFLPLPEAERKAREQQDDDDSEEESDGSEGEAGEWGGLSNDEDGSDDDEDDSDELDDDDDDDSPTVEVVDHSVSQAPKTSTMSKRELKAFMSSRPPDPTSSSSSSKPTPQPSAKSSAALPEDAPSLLAQDLVLRRLIAESHLLQTNKPTSLSAILSSSSSAQSEPKAFAAGRVRQKALDLRIQALGSKTSILKQEKMPMHMRKGINAAATERETKRRREAKESGVILERETGKKKKRERKSGGGVGFGPAVGRMRGAELRISERDVKKIEGARDTFGRRGKR